MATHKGQTDKTHRIQLPSSIQRVQWSRLQTAPGSTVGLEIDTRYVGNGSTLQIKLTDHRGTTHGTFKDEIQTNRLSSEVRVPEKAKEGLYAEVKLPNHGLKQKSPALVLTSPVKIKNPQWSQSATRRGDVLTLSAEVEGVPDGTESRFRIFEHDEEDAHDVVTELTTSVEDGKAEVDWEFVYLEDTDDIPREEETEKEYKAPEYFFQVEVEGITAQSDLLTFKDWIEVSLIDEDGQPVGEESYTLYMPDGNKRKGKLDSEGRAKEEEVPPGRCIVKFPDLL